MDTSTNQPADPSRSSASLPASGDNEGLRPWLIYVVPFVLYMLLNSIEPSRPAVAATAAGRHAEAEGKSEPKGGWFDLGIDYRYYPLIYAAKIALVGAYLLAMARDYARLPWRVSPLALAVGAVGVLLWVGITELGLEPKLLNPIGLGRFVASGARAAYNPLAELKETPALAWGFLVVRFVGLALVVPIIEELFLRGFLMRFITDQKWWCVPLATVSTTAIIVTTLLAMSMHPAELFAELVWFSSVTWLMLRSGNLTDCIVAHAVTNLLLGLYVVSTGSWSYM